MLLFAFLLMPFTQCKKIAWIIESEAYANNVRAALQSSGNTDWNLIWCGFNGTFCSDGSKASVVAVIGRADAVDLDSLSKTYPPAAYLRSRSLRELCILSDGTVPSIAGDWSGESIIGDVRESDVYDVWCRLIEQRRVTYREQFDVIKNYVGAAS